MKIDPALRKELKEYIESRISSALKEITILSSYPLTREELDLLHKQFPFFEDSHIKNEIDEDLIAGVVIKFGTKMIDLSLKSKLQSLHQSLL